MRRVARILVYFIAAVVIIAVIGAALLQTAWMKNYLRGIAEQQAERFTGADVSIRALTGNLITGAVLHGVRLTRDGQPIVHAPQVAVEYSLLDLLTGDVDIGSIRLVDPVVHLRRTPEGYLNLAALGRAAAEGERPAASSGTARRGWGIGDAAVEDGTLVIHDNVVTGQAFNAPERLVDIDGSINLGARAGSPGLALHIDQLSFRAETPALRVTSASGDLLFSPEAFRFDDLEVSTAAGHISVDGAVADRPNTPRLDLQIDARNVRLPVLAPFVPAVKGLEFSPTLSASLEGPLSALDTTFDLGTDAGSISGDVTLDATSPDRALEGTVRTRNLNVAAFQGGDGTPTDLTMTATLDLKAPGGEMADLEGTYALEAPEFTYGPYQAQRVHAQGRIDAPEVQVDATAALYGGSAEINGAITLPTGDTPIRYDLDAQLRDVDSAQLPQAVRPAGPIPVSHTPEQPGQAVGLDANVHIRGRGGDVAIEGELMNLSLAGAQFGKTTTIDVTRRGSQASYEARGTVRGLDLQRLGREFGLPALTRERFDSDINASFDLRGRGGSLARLTLSGAATLTDSQLLGAHFSTLTVKPDLERGAGTVAFAGRFSNLDVGAVTERPALESDLQGHIDARVAFDDLGNPDFSLGALKASGQLTLDTSSIAGIPITRAFIDAAVNESTLSINRFSVTGPDLQMQLSGSLALNAPGPSAMRYLIDTPALQQFEALGVPVQGDVRLEGTVTGYLQRLQIEGALSGTHVGYRDFTALSIQGDYNVIVPDLEPTTATVTAEAELSDLEVAARDFASVNARVDYEDGVLGFATRITDVEQAVGAEGRLVWHADHQELHLQRLRLEAPETVWSTSAGREATIRYGGNRLAIRDLRLATAAGGRIAVNGEIGTPDGALQVAIAGLQLDHVDDFFLDEPLSGLVNADAVIRGSVAQPRIDSTLTITDGSYRSFDYERVSGTIEYRPALLNLDVRVQQREGVALKAAGAIPLSAAAAEALDVTVQSNSIDLAMIQAFTDEISDVQGRVHADLHATGSLDAPRITGTLGVDGGAFTVAVAQSHYTGLDTVVEFTGEAANIREFRLWDDEGRPLTMGGTLALKGRDVTDLNLFVHSRGFELADNRLVEINADTDVTVTGSVTRPRIAGTVTLTDGFVRIDRLLETLQEPYELESDGTGSMDAASEPPTFAPTVALEVLIPEQFIVRGTDLRAAGGVPIGLGDVNITLGGNLVVQKQPGRDLRVLGEVRTVRGTYEFQGRQFNIERNGRVVLMGTDDLNPRLDITATREISGVTASVHITGELSDPELELSSSPPMEDAEILSLIVFNQPLSLLGAGEQVSLVTRATALASGFLASQLTESLGDALEIDILEIETATAEGAGLAPMLTLGEQFGRLFLKLQQRFGPEAVSRAVLEYRFTDWLRLQSSYAQGSTASRQLLQRIEVGGVDLAFRFTY